MGVPLPGEDEEDKPQAYLIEKFGSLNTKATRPGIGDSEFSWIENFMPIGDSNMRTLWAEDDPLYTAGAGKEIIFYYSFNIADTSYIAVFLDDGTAYQVRVSDGAVTTISATADKFWTSGDLPACSQWENKFLLIASTVSDDAYWIWDGSHLFGSGTLSPDVTITDSGTGYTSAPTLTAYGGTGTGSSFSVTEENGSVTDAAVTNPGSGYLFNERATLGFSGGGSDAGAVALATVTRTVGGVTGVIVTATGQNYAATTNVGFTGGGGSGAAASITGATNGQITAITIINPGHGYTSAPTLVLGDVGSGSGFTATVVITGGQVTAATISTGGSGYGTPPSIEITGDGVGATAVATLTAGAVSGITITDYGVGYSWAKFAFKGGNRAAQATVTMMPFGARGTTLETYQSRVWIAHGTTQQATSPGSTSDFATSTGGV
ncbi:MAG: hypothetical protein KGL39_39120, partial [Patescibacteria group bacterium]|nr:hypothetical protein [Patescibacteria group bacterium]